MTMKRISTFALLLGLVLVAGAAAGVTVTVFTTLFTPPLVPEGQNVLDCYLVNVSDQERQATIEVLNQDGTPLNSVGVTLNPGAEAVATVPASASPRYCKFQIEGTRLHFRASILVRQPGVGSISALPAE
jgi:hypothetical protein